MKKILSLMCAVMMIISASAAPKKGLKVLPLGKKAQKTELQVKKSAAPKAKAKAFEAKFAKLQPAAGALKAPKATTNVTVSNVVSKFYDSDNDIYYSLYNEDKSVIFCFDIVCAAGNKDVVSGQTYTLSDMLADYCEWVPANDVYNGTAFTAASFTKTVDADGSYTIVASATDANGDVWNLFAAVEAFVPQTYDLKMASATMKYYPDGSDMYIALEDSLKDHVFQFDILLPENQTSLVSGKTYTLAEMDQKYSKGIDYVNLMYINYKTVSFVQTMAADSSFTIAATVLDSLGNTWNLSYAQAAPKVSYKTLNLNGFVKIGNSMQQIEAANADSTELVSLIIITPADSLVGSFAENDLFTSWGLSYVLSDSVEYDIDKANINVAFDKTDSLFTVTGTITGVNPNDVTDVVIFTINLSCVGQFPEPEEPIVVPDTISGSGYKLDYNSSYWELTGSYSEDVFLGIMAKSATIAGHYGTADLDDYYTYIGLSTEVYYDMTEADLDVTFENNIITVKGTLTVTSEADPSDVKKVVIDITGTYTPPTERHYQYDEATPFSAEIPTYTVDSTNLAKYGVLIVKAINDNNEAVALEFFVKEGESTLVAGEYPIDNSENPGTLYASSGLNSQGGLTYSFVGIQGSQSWTNVWFLVAGKATVDDKGVITIAGLNSNNQTISVTLGQNPEGVENTKAASKATKRLVNGQLVIEKNGVLYNAFGSNIK